MAATAIYHNNAHWYLFLINPFIAGVVALKNFRSKWAKNVLWGFIVFYGFTLGISQETSNSADINRYITEMKLMYDKDLSINDIAELYDKNKDIDIARLTIAIGLSRVTNYAPVLTAVYGLIFGFFFTRNVWYLLDRLHDKIKPFTIMLLIAFILVNPFWNINGFRFYTATHIFIYGLLPYLFEKNKKLLIVSAASFLFHFSFMLPIGVLLLFIVLGNRTIIYFAFFLASILTSKLEIGSFNAFVEANAPKALSERTSSYRSERNVKSFRTGKDMYNQQTSWHAVYYIKALNWVLSGFLIFLFFKRKLLDKLNKGLLRALCFTLLMWGFANLLSSLPSGARYITIAYLSLLPLVIFYVHYLYKETILQRMLWISIPFLLLFIIVSSREGFYTLSLNTFVSNPIVAIFADYNFALNDFIK